MLILHQFYCTFSLSIGQCLAVYMYVGFPHLPVLSAFVEVSSWRVLVGFSSQQFMSLGV